MKDLKQTLLITLILGFASNAWALKISEGMARLTMMAWPKISAERITGHCDIAPGRKTDPGPAFDWSYFSQLLAHEEIA